MWVPVTSIHQLCRVHLLWQAHILIQQSCFSPSHLFHSGICACALTSCYLVILNIFVWIANASHRVVAMVKMADKVIHGSHRTLARTMRHARCFNFLVRPPNQCRLKLTHRGCTQHPDGHAGAWLSKNWELLRKTLAAPISATGVQSDSIGLHWADTLVLAVHATPIFLHLVVAANNPRATCG